MVGECEVFVTNHTVPEDDGYTEAGLLEGYFFSVSGTIRSYGKSIAVTLVSIGGSPLVKSVSGSSVNYSFTGVSAGYYTLKVEKRSRSMDRVYYRFESKYIRQGCDGVSVGRCEPRWRCDRS